VTRPPAPDSGLHFIHPETGEPVRDALADTVVLASSTTLGWDGLVVEVGESRNWQADGLAFAGHFVGLNLDTRPLHVEEKRSRGHARVTLAPGTLRISPAQAIFTERNLGIARWGAIEVSPAKVRRVLGCDIAPPQRYGVADELLTSVVRALVHEAWSQGGTGALFADSLTVALVSRLAALSSIAIGPARALVPRRLSMVIERIEDMIAGTITIEELAALADLSPAHFAREFKRCTHETPHAYITRRRLERARQLLLAGHSPSRAASACGFCDQSHLTRLFKQHFAVTPGAFVRSNTSQFHPRPPRPG
jgi:AraC-like DNA-binding protein